MIEPRSVVVLAVIVVAVLVAWAAHNGTGLWRRRVNIELPLSGVVLFTSDTCATCDRARTALEAAGVTTVSYLSWETSPEIFMAAKVERVPTLVKVDAAGRGWKVEGIPSRRRLRRWTREPR